MFLLTNGTSACIIDISTIHQGVAWKKLFENGSQNKKFEKPWTRACLAPTWKFLDVPQLRTTALKYHWSNGA